VEKAVNVMRIDQPEDVFRLKVMHDVKASSRRTVINQKDKNVPVFDGQDPAQPEWHCGSCRNVLATGVMMHPVGPGAVRFLPFPEGGETSILSIAVPKGRFIQSESGPVVIKCAGCGSFNETVPSEGNG
jgi:hypothetical protein